MKQLIFIPITICLFFSGCNKNEAVLAVEEQSSWKNIQNEIINNSCALSGCHLSKTDASFNQHSLLLENSIAYQSLVGVAPTNQNAQADGLKRVTPYNADKSLLFHKLNWNPAHHGGKSYGLPMPLGGLSLYKGQLEYIRRWIEAGAPEKGNVVDIKLLNDKTPVVTDSLTFIPLKTPSEEGVPGFQLKIEPFDVFPNFEREIFVRKAVNNKTDIYVKTIKLKSRPNSHHMVLYDFRNKSFMPSIDVVRDLRERNNTLNASTLISMTNHVFMGGGSDSNTEYSFPDGAALLLTKDFSIDLNPHYFNKTNFTLLGENYVNLYTIDQSKVVNVIKTLDLNNANVEVPANSTKTFTKDFLFNEDRKIIVLTSHTHKYGQKFIIKIKGGARDGEIIYETNDWLHPLFKKFDTPISLKKGEGLTSVVTYNNTSNQSVQTGLTSDDEMNIIFGYFY